MNPLNWIAKIFATGHFININHFQHPDYSTKQGVSDPTEAQLSQYSNKGCENIFYVLYPRVAMQVT